jgi:2-polyprenyl-3-methyl-5-hydroxy-6-metoxy-1,4-benzoquinol methylase
MPIIPWRVRNFFAQTMPLAYHLIFTGRDVHSAAYWDRRLEESWDSPSRNWPAKNRLIESLTSPDQRILDIGCGNGGILRHLKNCGYTGLVGLEHSAYACGRLAGEGITMIEGSLHDLPETGAPFDVVIASEVLEHIIRRDRFIGEIKKVLHPDGCVLVFVPNNCLNPLDEPEHVAVYSKTTLARFLARHFAAVEVTETMERDAPILFACSRRPKG